MASPSLLEWIMGLLRDSDARANFSRDPAAALTAAGFTTSCGQEVEAARLALADNPCIQQVAGVSLPNDSTDTTDNGQVGGVSLPPGTDAADQITFIINNYTITTDGDRNATVTGDDNTVTTGDNNTVVSGDDNTVVSGDGNAVGDNNNVINGDGNNQNVGDQNQNSGTINNGIANQLINGDVLSNGGLIGGDVIGGDVIGGDVLSNILGGGILSPGGDQNILNN
ncbi:MAG TPA: IniB N-terminal domain-containing protein, partial [Sporichthya sp.]|nr:IniB N-terminal domain-containing protein [Sporichthya sp.]